MKKKVILFCHPSMINLAKAVMDIAEDASSPMNCDNQPSAAGADFCAHRRVIFDEAGISFNKFMDGFPNLFIKDVKEVAQTDVIFIASFHTPEVIFEQLSVIYAIPRYLARSFTLILPYFPTGTMERVDTEGQIATAKTLAQLLSQIPLTSRGPAQVMIYDIHALQERFYFADTVIPRLETAIPLLRKQMQKLPNPDNVTIAFPDDGAHKRFHTLLGDQPVIICNKVRDGDRRIVKLKEGTATGRHVIIVDDLVQTGGTLIECAKALMAAGAEYVSAYVTHAVFPGKSWHRFLPASRPEVCFYKFYITDSLPHATEIACHPPFQLISLAPAIVETLLSYRASHA